jgi:hypothetical protein
MEFWVAFGVVCHFKQRKEDVRKEFLEVIHQLVGLKNVTEKDRKTYHLMLSEICQVHVYTLF